MMKKFWIKCKNFLMIIGLFVIHFFLGLFGEKEEEPVKEKRKERREEKKSLVKGKKKQVRLDEHESSGSSRSLFQEQFFTEKEIKEKIKKVYEKETKKVVWEYDSEYEGFEKKIYKKLGVKKYLKEEEKKLDLEIQKEVQENLEKEKVQVPIEENLIQKNEIREEKPVKKIEIVKSREIPLLKKDEKSSRKIVKEQPVKKTLEEKEFIQPKKIEFVPLEEKEISPFLEEKLEEKVLELQTCILKEKDVGKREILQKELQKIEKVKEDIQVKKEEKVLEEDSLEEVIPQEEKELVFLEIKKLQQKQTEEMEQKLLKSLENKSEEEIKQIEKIVAKERVNKMVKRLEIPLFLAFPFIRNPYFLTFTGGIFFYNHLSFLRNLLWRTPRNYEELSFMGLQRGKDALRESKKITAQNILLFSKILEEIFLKYPELREDEEFLNKVEQIQMNLYKEYFTLEKKEKKLAQKKNKINTQSRKLKKKDWRI